MELVAKHYVYEWVRPDYNVAFYVGKGSKKRAWEHKGNKLTKNIISYLNKNGMKHEVRILAHFVTTQAAFDFEIERIAFLKPLGELTNQTGGGEGAGSEEAKEYLRLINTGKKYSEETNKKKGRIGPKLTLTDEGRAVLKRPKSEETKAKMSATAAENNKNPEYRKKNSEGCARHHASKTTEERSAVASKGWETRRLKALLKQEI
jgi:hypothetical protein